MHRCATVPQQATGSTQHAARRLATAYLMAWPGAAALHQHSNNMWVAGGTSLCVVRLCLCGCFCVAPRMEWMKSGVAEACGGPGGR